jgi:hypothetical protein
MNKTEIKALLRHLEKNQQNMSTYQVDFIKGAKRYFVKYNKLSEKQIETLVNISRGVMIEK